MADTVLVQHVERFKQLLDHRYYVQLRVPIDFYHVVFQVAQCSSFLQDVKERTVFDDLRRFDNVWMSNSTQRVHSAPMDVPDRICTPVQLLFVYFLGNVKSASQLEPNLDHLTQSCILMVGLLDALDYLIELVELHRIPRDDRSFVIRYDTRLFLIGLSLSFLHFLYILVLLDVSILLLILGGLIFFRFK